MSYSRHTWECGETITADKMNNLEGGVEEALECCESSGGSEPLIVSIIAPENPQCENQLQLDKTIAEIDNAIQSGQAIIIRSSYDRNGLIFWSYDLLVIFVADASEGGTAIIRVCSDGSPLYPASPIDAMVEFESTSYNGYPIIECQA